MKEKEQSLKVECLKEHRITTIFGHAKVRRRLYRDNNGDYRFLLDEMMGLDKGCHISPKANTKTLFFVANAGISIADFGVHHG